MDENPTAFARINITDRSKARAQQESVHGKYWKVRTPRIPYNLLLQIPSYALVTSITILLSFPHLSHPPPPPPISHNLSLQLYHLS